MKSNKLATLLTPNRRLALGLALGLVGGMLWFRMLMGLGLGDRLRGDAGQYLRTALSFSSLTDALSYVGDRSVGFPLTIYVVKSIFDPFSTNLSLQTLVDLISLTLLGVHIASSLLFFFVMRRHAARSKVCLHWALGAILLAYPGMVAHTTVLLADTFCADLAMAAFALTVVAIEQPIWVRALASFAGGALFGFAALCRPSYEPAALGTLVIGVLVALLPSGEPNNMGAGVAERANRWLRRVSLSRLVVAGVFAVGFLACVLPAERHCAQRFGPRCLFDPQQQIAATLGSVSAGMSSPRLYWSRYAAPEEITPGCGPGCRLLYDETLASTWAVVCRPSAESFALGIPACFARRPDLGVLFLFKKTIALFDSYTLQDYAVDLTPRWARLWSRPFGAVAFTGFMFSIAFVVSCLWRREQRDLVPILVFSLALGLTHALTHVEGRYSYGLVAPALLSLFWLLGLAPSVALRTKLALYVAAILLGSAFFVQTASWDKSDPVLQRIESNIERQGRT